MRTINLIAHPLLRYLCQTKEFHRIWPGRLSSQTRIQRNGLSFLYPQERGYKIYPSDRTDQRCARHRFQQRKYRYLLWGRTRLQRTAKDTRTEWQKHSLRVLILALLKDYPNCRICGHRDLSPDLNGNGEIEPEEWIKACPCFNAEKDWDKV